MTVKNFKSVVSLLLVLSPGAFSFVADANFVQKTIPVEDYATAHVTVQRHHPMSREEVVYDEDIRFHAARTCQRVAWEYYNKFGTPLVPRGVRGQYVFLFNGNPEFISFSQDSFTKRECFCGKPDITWIIESDWECNGYWEFRPNGSPTHHGRGA